jgi:hypothetical protein
LRRLVKDSNPPSPQNPAKPPGQPLTGIQEIQPGKILLIQNIGELDPRQKPGTAVPNSPSIDTAIKIYNDEGGVNMVGINMCLSEVAKT